MLVEHSQMAQKRIIALRQDTLLISHCYSCLLQINPYVSYAQEKTFQIIGNIVGTYLMHAILSSTRS